MRIFSIPFIRSCYLMVLTTAFVALNPLSILGQATITVTVTGGTSSSECTDGNGPEYRWGVNIENEGWVIYPRDGFCYTNPPNDQYEETNDCFNLAPTTINVCFEAFEDDGLFCGLDKTCREIICGDFIVPPAGESLNHMLALPDGLTSEGEVTFTIATTGQYTGGLNDDMCGAFDLGLLQAGATLGDASLSNYNNDCADGANEPNTNVDGAGFGNDHSVWFTFTTNADPSSIISIIGRSDPEGLGRPLGLQLALYEAVDGTCDGALDLVGSGFQLPDFDEWMHGQCLKPNTTYYLMVDGFIPPPTSVFSGVFGLEITDENVTHSADLLCDAASLGAVPNGGGIGTGMTQSNICATVENTDPTDGVFFSLQNNVWFTFEAPDSRHVTIDLISSTSFESGGLDPVDIQLAVFESDNNACNGNLSLLTANDNTNSLGVSVDVNCLEPGNTYFIMMDGGPDDNEGVFEIQINDAGYNPIATTNIEPNLCFGESITVGNTVYDATGPINENIVTAEGCDSLVTGFLTIYDENIVTVDTAVCAGESITIAGSFYNTTGNYQDVIPGFNQCDSTILTNLIVAEEVMGEAVQSVEATAYLSPDGEATIDVMGGIPPYTYQWSDGQSTQTAIGLIGGTTYCVTVTDDIDCQIEDCVLVLFPSNIITTLDDFLLDCPGDNDGVLQLTISNGAVPYNYAWTNDDNSLVGNGAVTSEGGTAIINGLPSGNYSFTITDAFGLKVIDGNVVDPSPIETVLNETLCFGESLQVGSTIYNQSGIIDETLTSELGCDSIVSGVLNILPLNETILDESICAGEILEVGGNDYTVSGPIFETMMGFNGCDSIVSGNLTVLDVSSTTLNETLCFGESLVVGSTIYDATGPINEVLIAANGCDSIVGGTLTILPANTFTQSFSICNGESVEVGSSVYQTSGIYMDVLTDIGGCDSTVTTNLTVNPAIVLSADQTVEATAYLDPSGVATANVQGGSGNYNFLWSTGADTQIAAGLQGGMTYCVTVTDEIGCSEEDCVLVLFPSDIQTTLPNHTLVCDGDDDGVLNLSVFNGVAPYAYQWQNGTNSLNGSGTINLEGGVATITNLPAGSYNFTITDAFGETTANAQVIDPPELFTTLNETLCFGEVLQVGNTEYNSNGFINETIPSFQGCDSTIVGILTILPLNETTLDETLCFGETLLVGGIEYDVSGPINETLTAVNGCDSLVTGQLTILPEISTQINPTICFGENFDIGISSYNVTGIYEDVFPAVNGCDSTVVTNLTVLDDLMLQTNLTTEASGLGDIDGVANVSVGGGSGNVSYLWDNGQTTATATGLEGGQTYCVTVTDNVGCTAEDCIQILFPVNIITIIQDDTLDCAGASDGTLSFEISNGQAPYSYVWEDEFGTLNGNGIVDIEGGTAMITNLIEGNYNITITDAWGQTIINGTVRNPEPIVVALMNNNDASCFETCDAGASIQINGGTSPYNILWPDGQTTAVVNDLCAGTYMVSVTDAVNCLTTYSVTVGEPGEFIVDVFEMQPATCFGGNDGQADVNTNGNPISYLWDNGETTSTAMNLEAGLHTVTVTNMDNCTAVTSVLINQPLASLDLSITLSTPISCANATDGALEAIVMGGTGNLQYEWSNGENTTQITDLAGGIYTLTITDQNGCTISNSFDITTPAAIELDLSIIDINCLGGDRSGALVIDQVSGGVGPYLFSTDGNFFVADSAFVGLASGDYEIYVEDAVGCVEVFPARINDPDFVTVDLGDDEVINLGEEIRLDPFATSNNLIYTWSPIDSISCSDCPSVTVNPTFTTLYTVGVIDTITNCTATDQINVTVVKDRNIFIPNVFSPNDDGLNDYFEIKGGIDVERVKTFQVFNRWGALMFQANDFPTDNYNYAWDGRYRGKEMDEGVYVYFVEVEFKDGEVIKYSGDVAILK